ncbi:MAG: GntR family transcriptional regulator [Solirubrobacteraceae bacterium]
MPEPLAKLQRVGLADEVYEALRRRLMNGSFRSEEKLSLQELAVQLGVSRSPVHQALTRLVAEGMLDVRPRRGYFVAPLTVKIVEDAYDVRLALELLGAERTVGRLSPAELAELRERMEATLPHRGARLAGRTWHDANRGFHMFQIDLAGNQPLSDAYSRLSVNLLMERVLAGEEGPWMDAMNREHIEIVEAFEASDLAGAEAAIRRHNESGRVIAAEAIERNGGKA